MSDFLRADARMALARYESSVAAFGMEAGFPMKDVRIVQEYIDRLEAALREIAAGYETPWSTSTVGNMLDVAEILSKRINIARKALEGKDDFVG